METLSTIILFPPIILLESPAENARIPTTLLNFKDGEYNPDGSLPVITYEDPDPGDWVEVFWLWTSTEMEKEILANPS